MLFSFYINQVSTHTRLSLLRSVGRRMRTWRDIVVAKYPKKHKEGNQAHACTRYVIHQVCTRCGTLRSYSLYKKWLLGTKPPPKPKQHTPQSNKYHFETVLLHHILRSLQNSNKNNENSLPKAAMYLVPCLCQLLFNMHTRFENDITQFRVGQWQTRGSNKCSPTRIASQEINWSFC